MTLEIGLLFALIAVMVTLFLTEKLPVDLTAFAGLCIMVIAGFVPPEDAFTGFSSPAVITMLSIFIVSAALQYTGVAGAIGARIHRVVGSREIPLIAAIMIVAGVLSAFMNNVAATAVLLPAVVSLAHRAKISPSRLLMPLAFGAILGGTMTLVGTPPNLLAAEALAARGLTPFGLFEFTPFGVVLLAAGVIFMVTIGRKLLPNRHEGMAASERTDLADVYKLDERLFRLRIPEDSPLAGKSLSEAGLAASLGVQVVAVDREGGECLAPDGDEIIQGRDSLIVEGRRTEIEGRLGFQDSTFQTLGAVAEEFSCHEVRGIVVRIREGSPLVDRSLRDMKFRKENHVSVAAIWRNGEPLVGDIGDTPFRIGDEMLALGLNARIDHCAARADVDIVAEGKEALQRLDASLFSLTIPLGSHLAGMTIGETKLRERFDLTVVAIVRHGEPELLTSPDERVEAGNRLVVYGRPTRIGQLLEVGHVEVADHGKQHTLESADIGLIEVVIAPRSNAVGRTLRELTFRKRYGLRALALWRAGKPVRTNLPDRKLRLGDGLLLHGPREKFGLIKDDPDFVVLTAGIQGNEPHRPTKAPIALGGLALMVGLVIAGLFPIQVAAFIAATVVILARALHMREAYRAIEWRAVFLVAAILPVGVAMENTGAAQFLANSVAGLAGSIGPYGVLIALMVLSSLLSQGLDGAPTVVLLAPVVVSTAEGLDLSPYPLMMGVSLAASAAFMTPFSHKANLLVMGAGGYRSMDYIRVGTPLTVVVLALLAVMIPVLMPFGQ